MKNKLMLSVVALALPAGAQTSTYHYPAAPTPAPASSLWSWFIGGSGGYMANAEEGYYAGQLGIDTPWNLGGWNVALFTEVGYSQTSDRVFAFGLPVDIDTDLIPITFDVKFEHVLAGNLSAYLGAGVGAAFISADAKSPLFPGKLSNDDTVFAGSLSAGLVYNVNSFFEIYGGARWMYLGDTDVGGYSGGNNDDWIFELGLRFNLGPPTN